MSTSLDAFSSAGTEIGNIGLWEVASGTNLIYIHFEVWDEESYSAYFKVCLTPL